MTCTNCGSGMVVCIDSEGGTREGRFTEKYECEVCNANGYISGEASDSPDKWERYGGAFE